MYRNYILNIILNYKNKELSLSKYDFKKYILFENLGNNKSNKYFLN